MTPVILTLKLSTINTSLFNLHKTATTGTLQQKWNREKKCDVTLPWYQNFWIRALGSLTNEDGEGNENSARASCSSTFLSRRCT